MNYQLKRNLDENNIFYPSQSGFRKLHRTITASLKVLSNIYEALDVKEILCCSFFIGVSKALDTVDRGTLCQLLHFRPSSWWVF